MTNDVLGAILPGKGMDELVARQVMGWVRGEVEICSERGEFEDHHVPCWRDGQGRHASKLTHFKPSQDDRSALLVWQHLRGRRPGLYALYWDSHHDRVQAKYHEPDHQGSPQKDRGELRVDEATLPLAICRLALRLTQENHDGVPDGDGKRLA